MFLPQARHVRRKQLHQYLSPLLLKRERTASGTKRKHDAHAHAHAHSNQLGNAAVKKTKRLSESSVSINRRPYCTEKCLFEPINIKNIIL